MDVEASVDEREEHNAHYRAHNQPQDELLRHTFVLHVCNAAVNRKPLLGMVLDATSIQPIRLFTPKASGRVQVKHANARYQRENRSSRSQART